MRRSLKQAWIADLRANPDKQGFGVLTRITSAGELDCCWGRLCKIQQLPRQTEEDQRVFYGGQGGYYMPPVEAGVDGLDNLRYENGQPLRNRNGATVCLSGCNDERMPFPQIADLIDYFIPEEDDDAATP